MIETNREIPPGLVIPLENRAAWEHHAGKRAYHTPPSSNSERPHYPHQYLWDSCYSAMAYARHDFVREAVEEIYSIFDAQDPQTGFIPNMKFAPFGRRLDPERPTFMDGSKQSDYTQPPLMAKAIAETFDAFVRNGQEAQGMLFLEDTYPKLKKAYEYFINYRQNSPDDLLIGNIHPHETGRDSDPTFDFIKWRLERDGPNTPKWKDLANSGLDYFGAITQNVKNRFKNWDIARIRKQFWVNDVMFNCMYANNLDILGNIAQKIGKSQDAADFKELSVKVQAQIQYKMWDPNARDGDGAFYGLDKDGDMIRKVSISNLFPLLNANLPEHQLTSILTLINKSFNAKYQLPTVATDDPDYDPDYQGKGIMWRGPVWLWMNDSIAEGLEHQFDRQDIPPNTRIKCGLLAPKIRNDSKELAVDGRETHNPNTGEGQRMHHFSANAIGYMAMRNSVLIYQNCRGA